MRFLQNITKPADLAHLQYPELDVLASEIRGFLVDKVSKTGGHLGPNLGVVELTLAIHRVFSSPTDAIVFDTGHQAYVHKVLTGRAAGFDQLRQEGGLSGYPSRRESTHDIVENSHASAALSWADGIAKGWELQGQLGKRHVVAVVGDGALTGGMAWEALNNIAAAKTRPLVIVVNDNGRSYAETIGGVARLLADRRTSATLAAFRTHKRYERFLAFVKRTLTSTPLVGDTAFSVAHGVKKGIKDIVAPQGMFEDLGLKYIGPIDGHNIEDVERALKRAKQFPGPVLVHCITEKGRGYVPAADDELEKFHAIGTIDPVTGQSLRSNDPTWTSAFGAELVAIGREHSDVVAITAAMPGPTGLDPFKAQFPDRTFDVGIAEQHGATSAAGLAFAGMHPVFAVYSTFLNRAFDQVLMDCALHRAGVTFVLDRAGVTGDDGATHNGMWDLALMRMVPGLRVAAPRDAQTLRSALRRAVETNDGPTVIRFPKGALTPDTNPIRNVGQVQVLFDSAEPQMLIVGCGVGATIGVQVAEKLSQQGIGVTVVDPVWVLPVQSDLIALARNKRLVVSIEDGIRAGGVGEALELALRDAAVGSDLRIVGLPTAFFEHGSRASLLANVGMTATDIARDLAGAVAELESERAERL